MSGLSDSLKILNQKSVSMADLSKVYKNVKGKFEGVTWQSVRTKASRPILKELLRAKIDKGKQKFIKKEEKKRKRDDDEIEKEMAQVKRIGKRVKKATRKDKGKLGELVEEIDKREPTREKYIVVTVEFYDAPVRHFIVTPFNKEKIIDTLRYLTKTKEVGQEFIGSGEVASLKPGMRIKKYVLFSQDSFKQKVATKSLFKKKTRGSLLPLSTCNKKRTR